MRRTALAIIVGAACVSLGANVQAGPLSSWEDSFPTSAAPDHVFFKARYVGKDGASHSLEVWRDGNQRLRRVTDDRLDLVVTVDGRGESSYRLADRANHILFRADRTSLYRIGRFSDWRGLAHVLDVPRRSYTLTKLPVEAETASTLPCAWYQLEVADDGTPVRRICWSRRWGIPLTIKVRQPEGWEAKFQVLDVRIFDLSEVKFSVNAEAFVEFDATNSDEISD